MSAASNKIRLPQIAKCLTQLPQNLPPIPFFVNQSVARHREAPPMMSTRIVLGSISSLKHIAVHNEGSLKALQRRFANLVGFNHFVTDFF